MDVNQIIDRLREHRGQLDRAIAALDGERTPKHPGNGRHRKPMSAAAKKRIGRAMRRAWKRRKQKKG